jgi:hypothetical protein
MKTTRSSSIWQPLAIGAVTLIVVGAQPPRAVASPREDLVFAVQESNHDKHTGWVVERLMTFHIGDKCYAKIADKKNAALAKIASEARYIQRYAEKISGDDWVHIESQGANNREANRAIVDKMVHDFEPKFHLTVNLEGDDCDAGSTALWLKYPSHVAIALGKYPPKAGKLTVVIDVTSKTKTLKVEVDKDGTMLKITAARDIEAGNWSGEIDSALKRISSNG